MLTFKHFNSNCGFSWPATKIDCRSLGNLTKSTFTNDFIYSHKVSGNFPRAR